MYKAWYQIEEQCEEKQNWFKDNLGLKLENGIPSHDKFERISAMIEPNELEKSFVSWVKAVNKLTERESV